MSEASHDSGRGPYQRQVEIGVALGTALFGAVVMYGSVKVGIGWGVEGPKAGFFPFYVGLSIVLSSGSICCAPSRTPIRNGCSQAGRSCDR